MDPLPFGEKEIFNSIWAPFEPNSLITELFPKQKQCLFSSKSLKEDAYMGNTIA